MLSSKNIFHQTSVSFLSSKHHIFVCVFQLQELLKDFNQPVRIELATFEPSDEPDKTNILFMSFDASRNDMPLRVEDQLDYIRSLNTTNITVKHGVIHWDGRCWWITSSTCSGHRIQTSNFLFFWHLSYLLWMFVCQVQICVLPPSKRCVPLILCAFPLWAPTPACASMATTMWALSSSVLGLHIQSAMVNS